MATFLYKCPEHGTVEVVKSMAEATHPEVCGRCARDLGAEGRGRVYALQPMRRLFTAPAHIIRPSGWNLRPGDHGYSDFSREAELGELRQGSMEPVLHTPDVASRDPLVLPRLSEDALQEIHEVGRTIDRNIREEMTFPELYDI